MTTSYPSRAVQWLFVLLPIFPMTSESGRAQMPANVLLGLDANVGVAHDVDFFNRRLLLTFKYRTSEPTGNTCSDDDLDNVELVVNLPTQTAFVEAREFGQVVAPSQQSGGTVTWSFGTVGRFAHCDPDTRGTDFVVTIDVDPSLANHTPLQATASISTTTSGDDPADNQATVTFAAVMFPLEVVVTSVESQCEAAAITKSATDGIVISCAPGPAWTSVAGTAPPGKLADVPLGGKAELKLGVSGFSRAGYHADASVDASIEIRNPNAFRLPLRVHVDVRFNCHVLGGSATASPQVKGILTDEAECGFGNLDEMSEHLFLHFSAEGGPDGVCRRLIDVHSTERGDETEETTDPICTHQSVRPAITSESGTTVGTLELDFGLTGDMVGDGYAQANARARVCVAVGLTPPGAGNDPCFFGLSVLDVIALSPVDLLITNESGESVGRVDDPDLGPVNVAEIPGAHYSGPGSEPQQVLVGLPEPGEYAVTVVGTGEGPYTLIVRGVDEDGATISEQSIAGQASIGSITQQSLLLGTDGAVAFEPVLALEDVADHLLGEAGALTDNETRFLDLLGNGNGVFDVGDFRAYLEATGGLNAVLGATGKRLSRQLRPQL